MPCALPPAASANSTTCSPCPTGLLTKWAAPWVSASLPIKRGGVYVPGGTAPLPSSLLMSVIPAQVAGVAEIIVATPPDRETGKVADVILAAAAICGIDTVIMWAARRPLPPWPLARKACRA